MPSLPIPTPLLALLVAGLASLGLVSLAPTGPAAAADRQVVHQATFETDLGGFAGVPGTTVRLTAAGSGRDGGRAMELRPLTTGPAAAVAPLGAATPGATYDAQVWVRASMRTTATFRLRAVQDGQVVDVDADAQSAGPRGWIALSTRMVAQDGNDLSLRVSASRLRPDERLLVDDVQVWRTDGTAEPPTVPEEPVAPGGDPLTNGCTYDARGIPSCGVYVGAAHGSNSDPTALETELGRQLSVRRTYYTSTGVASAVRTAQTDVAAGRIPWISFKLPASWADMAAGAGDAWARDLATRLAAVDGPVWVAFHHEPEGDGNIQDWRRMQERLAPILRGAPNVAFTVIVTGWHQFYGDAQYRLSEIWPRGVEVDVAGFDIYQNYGVVKDGTTTTKWTDFSAYFSQIETWADQVGVEWGLAETGITDVAASADREEIPDTVDLMEQYDGIAYSYFDTTLNSIAPWDLGTAAKKEQFGRALVGSPAMAG